MIPPTPSFQDIQPDFVVLVGADVTKLTVSGLPARGGGIRGTVTRFSEQSRKRLMERVAMVRLPFIGCYFMTLTYPGVYPLDPGVWKRHLDTFLKRLSRRFVAASGMWRLEFQQRGAPHYHLIVWGLRIDQVLLRSWVRDAWYEVVGSQDVRHLMAGTQVDLVANRRYAGRYISKYAAKVSSVPVDPQTGELLHVGRWWGIFGDLPMRPVLRVKITSKQAVDLKRLVAHLLKSRGVRYSRTIKRLPPYRGFSAFGLGDLTFDGWSSLFDSTAFRLIWSVLG